MIKDVLFYRIFLTLLVPIYNESEVLRSFHVHLSNVLNAIDKAIEILYIDDGSRDDSWSILVELIYKKLPPLH